MYLSVFIKSGHVLYCFFCVVYFRLKAFGKNRKNKIHGKLAILQYKILVFMWNKKSHNTLLLFIIKTKYSPMRSRELWWLTTMIHGWSFWRCSSPRTVILMPRTQNTERPHLEYILKYTCINISNKISPKLAISVFTNT